MGIDFRIIKTTFSMKTFTIALLASATQAVEWGYQSPVHSHYRDIKVNQAYTQDASYNKSITDAKTRQEPEYYTHTTSSIAYDEGRQATTKDWLKTEVENRPQEVNSTSYSTKAVQGSQSVTRYDVVNADRQTTKDVFVVSPKNVGIIESEVAYDTVTSTRDNLIEINKLRDVVKTRQVEKTVLVDVQSTCQRMENQPITRKEIINVPKTCARQENQPTLSTEIINIPKTCSRQENNPISKIVLVDVPSKCAVNKTVSETVLVDVQKSKQVKSYDTVIDTTYTQKTLLVHGSSSDDDSDSYSSHSYSSSCDGPWCSSSDNSHVYITKNIPKKVARQVPVSRTVNYTTKEPRTQSKVITVQEDCTAQEERQILEDNIVTINYSCDEQQERQVSMDNIVTIEYSCDEQQERQVSMDNIVTIAYSCDEQQEIEVQEDNIFTINEACTVQKPQTVLETETYTEKEPYVEVRNVPTTTTQQIPRTVLINKTKQVDSHSIGQEAYTRKQNISVPRQEAAPTNSIEAVRNDSSRLADKAVNVQSVIQVAGLDKATYTPKTVTSSRQRRRYNDVDASVTRDIKIQGVSNHNQVLTRQARLQHSHSTLAANNPNLDIISVTSASDLGGYKYGNSYKSGYRKHW